VASDPDETAARPERLEGEAGADAAVSRRHILRRAGVTAAGIGVAAAGAATMLRADPVLADGEAIRVGGTYTDATHATSIVNGTNDADVLVVESKGTGSAITGRTHSATGVEGHSVEALGVWGTSSRTVGVYGQGPTGVDGAGLKIGVYGQCLTGIGVDGFGGDFGVRGRLFGDASGTAVYGETKGSPTQVAVLGDSDPYGYGVKGLTKDGIGVYAQAKGGYALQVDGRAVFSRSGMVTIAAGTSTTDVSVYLSSASLVLATIQSYHAGVWVAGVSLNTSDGLATIHLNKAAPANLKVGWFVAN
jgi:hypothetical protein